MDRACPQAPNASCNPALVGSVAAELRWPAARSRPADLIVGRACPQAIHSTCNPALVAFVRAERYRIAVA